MWHRWFPVGLAFAALLSFTVVVLLFAGKSDGLVAVKGFDYTNDFPLRGFKVVCSNRGSRDDFNPDGSDLAVGDRLVRDCRVVAR